MDNPLIKRENFVENFTTYMKEILTKTLPEESTESTFIIEAWKLVFQRVCHIKEAFIGLKIVPDKRRSQDYIQRRK